MAWSDGRQRLCRQGDANMGAGSAGKGGPCWRGPTEDKGFAGRATPTWAPAVQERAGLVGVSRRKTKALPGGRRQHGRRQRGKGRSLLAWPDEGLRLYRQGDANMGAGSARKGGACWRGPTEDKGFAGRATPTWAGARRDSGRPVGVARRKTKALPGGRCLRRMRKNQKKRAKPPHMNCDCSALYLLNCPTDSTYRICLPSLPRRS